MLALLFVNIHSKMYVYVTLRILQSQIGKNLKKLFPLKSCHIICRAGGPIITIIPNQSPQKVN